MTIKRAVLVLYSLATWKGQDHPITDEIVEAINTIESVEAITPLQRKRLKDYRNDKKTKMIDAYEFKQYIYRLMDYRERNKEKPHDDLYAALGHIQILIEE